MFPWFLLTKDTPKAAGIQYNFWEGLERLANLSLGWCAEVAVWTPRKFDAKYPNRGGVLEGEGKMGQILKLRNFQSCSCKNQSNWKWFSGKAPSSQFHAWHSCGHFRVFQLNEMYWKRSFSCGQHDRVVNFEANCSGLWHSSSGYFVSLMIKPLNLWIFTSATHPNDLGTSTSQSKRWFPSNLFVGSQSSSQKIIWVASSFDRL